ncbi:methyl-accepting chemotaxis protein [Uliginosibacterium sp. 31-12]|uniref:methyl-accepting chemotaxis protein n=1 Tax=Uliginosibacterium sp. 31-12 TaxID=3062781 RepID=UPI0026E162E3|nr:methyl-accepting chemotaxis protein [Uliginosibacterium sp. 31-12]MDO6387821.1 methyl-accepting chemotaxis protein [Uliginosibacterium sp. 31-12]
MKLSSRLVLIIGSALIGLLLIAGIALQIIRSTMATERENQTRTLLNLSVGILKHFHEMETSGKLSREEAQARASQALQGLKHENDYVFARTDENVLVAHVKTDRIGKVDLGSKVPDGRTTVEVYRDALTKADPAFVTIYTTRPGSDSKAAQLPKLNGVTRFAPWSWTVGTGFFMDDIDAAFRHYALLLLLAGLVIIAVSASLAVVMARNIYRQLGGEPDMATAAANQIATGHLGQHLPDSHEGSLLNALKSMQTNLQSMIASIKHSAQSLNSAANDIASRMDVIRESSGHSSEATAATAAAIEEMTVSVGQIADSAHETERSSGRSAELAASGSQRVAAAAEAIHAVSGTVADASDKIVGLADRTRQIDGIANTIKEIAEQTNLLALNAAIEAARAGEQGRGFAVVADEVRKLAERTTKATAEITQTIAAVQADTDSVVHSMNTVRPLVEKGVTLATEAAEALDGINRETGETLAKIHDVAHATSEQTAASNSIATNVERIARMVEDSDSAVRSASDTARQLAALATELNTAAARFST